jgi:hypothetical protein
VKLPRKKQEGELALKERWYPIQVKQKDKVGRPDILMISLLRSLGFFNFDFLQICQP